MINKEKIKVGKKTATTNNYVVRFWSHSNWGSKYKKTAHRLHTGTVTNTRTNDCKHFHSAGELLTLMETFYIADEKSRWEEQKLNIVDLSKKPLKEQLQYLINNTGDSEGVLMLHLKTLLARLELEEKENE